MMPVIKMVLKGNTHVPSLLMFYENRKSVIFKVLSYIVYCIMDKYSYVDYLCFPQTKLRVTTKRQVFEK